MIIMGVDNLSLSFFTLYKKELKALVVSNFGRFVRYLNFYYSYRLHGRMDGQTVIWYLTRFLMLFIYIYITLYLSRLVIGVTISNQQHEQNYYTLFWQILREFENYNNNNLKNNNILYLPSKYCIF